MKFQSILKKDNKSLGWTTAHVPFDPRATWPEMIRLRVQGTIDGYAFRTSLFPDPCGGFFLLVTRAMQQATGLGPGDAAEFTLAPDLEPRPAELPDSLAALLDDDPALRTWYDTLTEYIRREIGKWVLGVKSEEAQVRRAQQMAERLLATMEAERELPPLIARAFARNAKAQAGWDTMTTAQRRAELMAVFYYQTPEARAKRLDKTIALAAAKSPA